MPAASFILIGITTAITTRPTLHRRASPMCRCAEIRCSAAGVDGSDALTLELKLMRLAAVTDRGACRTNEDELRIYGLIDQLEGCNQAEPPAAGALDGTWRLAFSSCPPYRSSPFFAAFGQLVGDVASPLLFSVTDGLPFFRVGAARQIIANTAATSPSEGTLVSQIEVELYAFDALLPPVRSVMTTSASARADDKDAATLVLGLLRTEVKDSALPFSSALAFPVQQTFDGLKSGSATIRQRTSYLSPTLRITRAMANNDIFVYARE